MSTLAAFLVFAQEAAHGAEEEETSKTLFYVVGGIAAVYAVALTAFGLTNHEFPKTKSAARGVCALSAVVVAAAMASSIVTS